jgi:hypothetical protein
VQWERPLHTYTEGHLTGCERLAKAPSAAADHNALEDLDALAAGFGNAGVDANGIARPEVRQVFAQARLLDEIDLVHEGTSIRGS